MNRHILLIAVPLALLVLPLLARLLITTTDQPAPGGVQDGKLAPCPTSPNCVSSRPADPTNLPPISYRDTREQAMQRLIAAVQAEPRHRIVAQTDDYLHIQFRSLLFGFGDDAEFFFPPTTNTIEFRSAARMGYSDMNVNQNRMERIISRMATSSP